jgi:hypothetical protein
MHRSFFSSYGLIQRSSTVLAQHLTRYSITKLVAVILSHLAMLSSLTILNKATVVLAMTTSPFAQLVSVSLFTVSTAPIAPTTTIKATAFTAITPLPAANNNTTAPKAEGATTTCALENTTFVTFK